MTFSKLYKLLFITIFYPASYLIEENNKLPDLYTIGNLTVYTIVLTYLLLSKPIFVYNGLISESLAWNFNTLWTSQSDAF